MSVYASAYVRMGDQFVTVDALLADRALLAVSGLEKNPRGGVLFGTAGDIYRIDDAVGFVVDAVLVDGPALLRAGQSLRYPLRLSHGTEVIEVASGVASADDGAGAHVEVAAEDLAQAFEAALERYREARAFLAG